MLKSLNAYLTSLDHITEFIRWLEEENLPVSDFMMKSDSEQAVVYIDFLEISIDKNDSRLSKLNQL